MLTEPRPLDRTIPRLVEDLHFD